MSSLQDLYGVRSDLGNLFKALGRLEDAKVQKSGTVGVSLMCVFLWCVCFCGHGGHCRTSAFLCRQHNPLLLCNSHFSQRERGRAGDGVSGEVKNR